MKVLLGYLMMLAVMTYNGYIAFAVIAGATFGYFIFGYRVNLAETFKRNCPSSAVSSGTSQTIMNSSDEAAKPLTAEDKSIAT